MIVFPAQELVIVTPPKTGSTSLHHHLCVQGPGIYVVGPQMDGEFEKHVTTVPWSWKDYDIVVMVRDPYARAQSLWKHYKKYAGTADFPTWVRTILLSNQSPFNLPISSLLGDLKYTGFHKLEELGKIKGIDLSQLPNMNQSDSLWVSDYDDADTVKLVRYWAHWDFENFDYSRAFSG